MDFYTYASQYPTGEKHILVTIDPDGTPIRLSSAGYVTSPTDATLPNTAFRGMIERSGIPRISRSIGDRWGGRGVSSWGSITLIFPVVKTGVDLRTADIVGKKVEIRLVGPPDLVSYSEAAVTLIGYIRPRSGVVGGSLVLNIADRGKQLERVIPVKRYDKTAESAYFPASNDKAVKQIVLGTCKNVPCTLIDIDLDKYQVSDPTWPVNSIVAVYVNGMSVSFTADLTNNTFTLPVPANSNETVTAHVEGVKEGATFLSTHEQILSWVIRTFTSFNTVGQLDISGLPSGAAQYVISSEVSVDQVVTDLTRSCLAQHYVTPDDKLTIKPLQLPASGGPIIGESKHIGEVSWQELEEIYYRIPFTYDNNFATLTTIAGALADPDREIWLKGENLKGAVENLAILTTYPLSTVAPEMRTFFVNQADAQAVANTALTLYGTQRFQAEVTLPMQTTQLELFSSVELADAVPVEGDSIVHSITEDYTQAVPLYTLQVWK